MQGIIQAGAEEGCVDKMLIYLDLCCFNRPYDDQGYLSIYLETQAKLEIQDFIKNGNIDLAWSTMLDFENNANIDKIVRDEIWGWRELADKIIHQTNDIVVKSKKYKLLGIHGKDAIHIACAVDSNASYFITTDNGILKRKNKIDEIDVINPVDFIRVMEVLNES